MSAPFGGKPDIFTSPNNPLNEYVVAPGADTIKDEGDLSGVDRVVILDKDGARLYDPFTLHVDILKRRPRITPKTAADLVQTAWVSWALAENDPKSEDDDEFDEDGVKKGAHFEGDFGNG